MHATYATILGLFAYYGSDTKCSAKGPNSGQRLVLKSFHPGPGQYDRGFVIYGGSQPFDPKTMVLTKSGTQRDSDTNTTCGFGFSAGSRRGLDTCAFFSGIDSPPPNRPSNRDGVATWSEYQTASIAWAQKNWGFLLVPRRRELQVLCTDADT